MTGTPVGSRTAQGSCNIITATSTCICTLLVVCIWMCDPLFNSLVIIRILSAVARTRLRDGFSSNDLESSADSDNLCRSGLEWIISGSLLFSRAFVFLLTNQNENAPAFIMKTPQHCCTSLTPCCTVSWPKRPFVMMDRNT